MEISAGCEIEGCGRAGATRCARCGRMACEEHVVADYTYLPGGQRPYCVDCDAERAQLYQTIRREGLRAIVWSGLGGVAGASLGYGIGAVVTSDSFAHTVSTDLGFLAGLALALAGSLSFAWKRQRSA